LGESQFHASPHQKKKKKKNARFHLKEKNWAWWYMPVIPMMVGSIK
jgi:hypothetical protein